MPGDETKDDGQPWEINVSSLSTDRHLGTRALILPSVAERHVYLAKQHPDVAKQLGGHVRPELERPDALRTGMDDAKQNKPVRTSLPEERQRETRVEKWHDAHLLR